MASNKLKRAVGLWGASVTLIGYVIGVSIFLLPGQLAASAGPGVILSYFIAGALGLVSSIIAAQIAVLFPVNGASFISISRVISPLYAFANVWMSVGAAIIGLAFLAYGFAEYFTVFTPGLDKTAVAAGVIILLGLLNVIGVKAAILGQSVMVVFFMVILVGFSLFGAAHIEPALLTPIAPNGARAIFSAAVPAFFSFTGLFLLVEMGGEITRPGRTIPMAIAIAFTFILVCYVSVSAVIVGIIPWQELSTINAPAAEVAARIMPPWAKPVLTVGIIFGAATSLNGVFFSVSRQIAVLSRARVFPLIFARHVHKGNPYLAVIFLASFAVIAILFRGSLSDYASIGVMKFMVLHILLSLVALKMPKFMPEYYAKSPLRLSPLVLRTTAYGLIAASCFYILIGFLDNVRITMVGIGIFLSGMALYVVRKRILMKSGVSIDDIIVNDLGAVEHMGIHDAPDDGSASKKDL